MFWKKSKDEQKPASQESTAFVPPAVRPPLPTAAQASQPVPAAPPSQAGSSPAAVPPRNSSQQAMSSALAMSFGKVVSVLMFSDRHSRMSLHDVSAAVLPAVAANQFVVAEARQKVPGTDQEVTAPVGALLWARVSDEVDRRFSADPSRPTQLTSEEWTGGDNYWVIESVGAPKVVEAMMRELMEGPFKGRIMKFRWTGMDGQQQIQTYDLRRA